MAKPRKSKAMRASAQTTNQMASPQHHHDVVSSAKNRESLMAPPNWRLPRGIRYLQGWMLLVAILAIYRFAEG
jgi:hypothetical protein